MARDIVLTIIGRDRASAVFDKVAASATRSASRMDRVNGAITAAGARLTRSVTVPVVAAAAASAKLATDFQSAMTRIQTQAGGSRRDVQLLSREVLNMSKSTQQGPIKLADALYHLKSVGMSNTKAMQALRQTTQLAAVGQANLEDTANALAGAWRTGIKGATNFREAVSTVNAIIGAGNMRMEDFNAAIGTGILPAAKTFGLSLKQVGGALALMTDEGVPAVDAATRLRMTFSLMGAPSRVATKWLGEIHLKALDLSKAMRHPNTGLIDAVTMLKDHLEKFGGSASKQSMILARAFGGGRSSATIMSLINNLDVLRKKQDQVNRTVGKFGGAVAAQQQTAQAKFSNLVSNLERVAIEVGNQVLPYLTQMVQKIGDGVRWFGNLSDSTRGFIVKAALVAAALGPMLSIIGRVGRAALLLGRGGAMFASWASAAVMGSVRVIAGMRAATLSMEGMTSGAYLAGRRIRGMFQQLGSTGVASMRLLGTAMGGGAIGVGVGELTKNSSKGVKALGVLGSSALGAAAGFAVGGPLGAAIGGISGAVGSLVMAFHHSGSAAQTSAKLAEAAMQQQKADANDLLGALQSVGGAYSDMYKQQLVNKLGASGALGIAAKAGVKLPSLINSVLTGDTGASVKQFAAIHVALTRAAFAGKITTGEYNKLNDVLKHMTPAAAAAEKQFELNSAAMGHGVVTASRLGSAMDKVRSAFHGTGAVLVGASAAADRNRAVLQQEVHAFDASATAAVKQGRSLASVIVTYGRHTSALKANMGALGFNQQAVANLIAEYARTPKQIITKLLANAEQGKGTAREFQQVIDAIRQNKIPGLTANSAAGASAVLALQSAIDRMHGKNVDLNVTTHYWTTGTQPTYGLSRGTTGRVMTPGFAKGTGNDALPKGVAAVGEHGPELAFTDRRGTRVLSNRDSRKFLALSGMRAPGFASGTTSLMRLIQQAGFRGGAANIMYGIAMAESGGNAHALNNNPSTGDLSYGLTQINMIGGLGPSRRRQFHLSSNSALFDPLTNLRVAYALSGHGRNFSPWTTYTRGLYRRFLGGAESASVRGGSSGGGSSSSSSAASHAAAVAQARNARLSAAVGGASTAISGINGIPASGSRFSTSTFNLATYKAQVAHAVAMIAATKAAGASAKTLAVFRDRLLGITKAGRAAERALLGGVNRSLSNLMSVSHGSSSDFLTAFNSLVDNLRRSGAATRTVTTLQHAETRLQTIRARGAAVASRLASTQQASAQMHGSVYSAVTGAFDITTAGQVYNDQPATAMSISSAAWDMFHKAQTFVAVLKRLRAEGLGPGLLAQLAAQGPAALPQAQALAAGTPKQMASITSAYAGLHTLAEQTADVTTGYAYGGTIKALASQEKALAKAFGDELIRAVGKPAVFNIYGVTDPVATAKAIERRQAALRL